MKLNSLLKKYFLSKPLKNIIVFESVPDLSDNTKAVFDEFLKRNFNKKYKLIWLVEKKSKQYPKIKNVKYFNNNLNKSVLDKLYRMKINYSAKCFISCNRCLTPTRDGQTSFYLTHGTPIKSVRKFYSVPESVNYTIVGSKNVEKLYAYEKHINEEKVIGLGYSRNDELTNRKIDLKKILDTECEKIIVWYPTYRQNKNYNGIVLKVPALPLLDDEEKAKELNDYARNCNTLIVAKPHFAQDISCIKKLNLSNIRLIDDKFFIENKISSYNFVGNCDALLTDYSSIYYDFTLCDKPIGVIWSDINEYSENPGFAVDLNFYLKGAVKIYDIEDYKKFIYNVSKNIDDLKKDRNEIKDFVNYSSDGKNSERVVDFIVEKAKLI